MSRGIGKFISIEFIQKFRTVREVVIFCLMFSFLKADFCCIYLYLVDSILGVPFLYFSLFIFSATLFYIYVFKPAEKCLKQFYTQNLCYKIRLATAASQPYLSLLLIKDGLNLTQPPNLGQGGRIAQSFKKYSDYNS